ncbi:MAG TPA: hypothetical protein PK890_11720 [Terrimesophilobacter sp.]|nr:hypothetical protein [Terrimesophilobacter sp.]
MVTTTQSSHENLADVPRPLVLALGPCDHVVSDLDLYRLRARERIQNSVG